ncbi:hypothetical protein SLEP1_g56976 [Rubroshorea leprosula]|uniref:C2H2-type domain-containing protein n=1 Tax=Rubroshorea leprosula TaxID=152421 RepID=A0AAV5MM89_9ROSI|nr:hypothetical protein SLEP1_g56976 [Rubroshorea leprosula]
MGEPFTHDSFSLSQPSVAKPTSSSAGCFPCRHCKQEFATLKAWAGHQKAHSRKLDAAAGPNFPANNKQEYPLLPLFRTAKPTNSSPGCFPCPHCEQEFATPKARAGHQKAHSRKRDAAAGPNFPANNQQEHPLDPLFCTFPHLQPPPHQQHEDQNLASSSVPRSLLCVSTADALSTTTDEDDSANMDLTLRL